MDGEKVQKVRLTPKGFFMAILIRLGATAEQAGDEWNSFEAFCEERAMLEYPESSRAALVFDEGGVVIGIMDE